MISLEFCNNYLVTVKVILIFMSLFVDLGALKNDEEEDVKVWEDNWDDDNIEDDFSAQLRYMLYH